jgi:hypothetical protein
MPPLTAARRHFPMTASVANATLVPRAITGISQNFGISLTFCQGTLRVKVNIHALLPLLDE